MRLLITALMVFINFVDGDGDDGSINHYRQHDLKQEI